ncbi:hypothetical protein RhoFasSB10_02537 [Rhodococcus fascians]|nr:hypothetical protein [Rhodococcus fascians]
MLFDSSNMNVHQHKLARSKSIVVFVHGLGGKGYETWKNFPKYVFEDVEGPPRDVAVYRYCDGPSSVVRFRPKLEAYLKQLSREIEELSELYDDIYFAAHSLGGLMSLQAVKHYFQSAPRAAGDIQSVAGFFLFGSPQAGSRWAVKAASLLVHELKWLVPYSKAQEDVSEFLSNHVYGIIDTLPTGHRSVIPRMACIGLRDKFVTSFSATTGIPSAQVERLECTHTDLVKPESNTSPQVRWLLNEIARVSIMRQERRLSTEHASPETVGPVARADYDPTRLVTEVWLDTDSRAWEAVYREACTAASNENVEVIDIFEVPSNTNAELHMSLHHSQNIIQGRQVDMVKIDVTFDNTASEISIFAVGHGHSEAVNKIKDRLGAERAAQHQGRLYIEGVANQAKLRQVLAEVIAQAVSRRSRKSHSLAHDYGRNDLKFVHSTFPKGVTE